MKSVMVMVCADNDDIANIILSFVRCAGHILNLSKAGLDSVLRIKWWREAGLYSCCLGQITEWQQFCERYCTDTKNGLL